MAAHADSGHVAHHFQNADQQYQSAKLAMWVFLATEVLFFGGLFCAYAVYRANHPEVFVYAHHFLDKSLGAANTVILICSSLTMAWAVRAAQLRQKSVLMLMLSLTLVFAVGFLGIKSVEYSHKWHHGLLWAGAYTHQDEPHGEAAEETHGGGAAAMAETVPVATEQPVAEVQPADPERSNFPPAAAGPSGLAEEGEGEAASEHLQAPRLARIFFSIYFLMTGLHGIHVLGGMGAMLWLLVRTHRGDFAGGYFTPVDMVGLYWHLVDLIWIYLFLLLYLIH